MRYLVVCVLAGLIAIAFWPWVKNFVLWAVSRVTDKSKEIDSIMKEESQDGTDDEKE